MAGEPPEGCWDGCRTGFIHPREPRCEPRGPAARNDDEAVPPVVLREGVTPQLAGWRRNPLASHGLGRSASARGVTHRSRTRLRLRLAPRALRALPLKPSAVAGMYETGSRENGLARGLFCGYNSPVFSTRNSSEQGWHGVPVQRTTCRILPRTHPRALRRAGMALAGLDRPVGPRTVRLSCRRSSGNRVLAWGYRCRSSQDSRSSGRSAFEREGWLPSWRLTDCQLL